MPTWILVLSIWKLARSFEILLGTTAMCIRLLPGAEVSRKYLSLLALICCQWVAAQEPASPQSMGPIEEVEVTAEREKLREMRAKLIEAEDRFYELYNKLNTDDQFDVVCSMEKRTGTNISARVCRPVFVNDATEEEAKAFLAGYFVPPAQMVIADKYPQFEKHMLAVINKQPELRKLIREHEKLQQRYEKERKERFKGRKILFE